MVENHNSKLTEELIQATRLQITDGVPNQIMHTIQPVLEVNPKLLRIANVVRNAVRTTTGSATILTTPADKDFYLTNYVISLAKDATCDAATGQATLGLFIDGTQRFLSGISFITLTAQATTISNPLSVPIKCDRSTNITFGLTFTAGAAAISAEIAGYFVDNPNA